VIIVSPLPLVLKIKIGASGDCVDCAIGWEVVVHAEVLMCLILFWSDGFVCLVWDTLFLVVAEGRLLKVVLGGFC
jgi:hypothetical protein